MDGNSEWIILLVSLLLGNMRLPPILLFYLRRPLRTGWVVFSAHCSTFTQVRSVEAVVLNSPVMILARCNGLWYAL